MELSETGLKMMGVDPNGDALGVGVTNNRSLKVRETKGYTKLLRLEKTWEESEVDVVTVIESFTPITLDCLRLSFSRDTFVLYAQLDIRGDDSWEPYRLISANGENKVNNNRLYPGNIDESFGDVLFEVVSNDESGRVIELKTPVSHHGGIRLRLFKTSPSVENIAVSGVYTEVI